MDTISDCAMIEQIEFRLATKSDASAMSLMSRDLIEYGLVWSWTRSRICRHIEDPDTVALVASIKFKPAGFGIMAYADAEASLKLLAVQPEYQRLGVGLRLIRWLEKSALVAGIPNIYLELRESNTGAFTFYKELGYQKIGVIAGYYQGIESAIRMGCDLWSRKSLTQY